jgi:nucleotide-binding universal stress UspA family protein
MVGFSADETGQDAVALGELLARTSDADLITVRIGAGTSEEVEAEAVGLVTGSPVRVRAEAGADGSVAEALLERATVDADVGAVALGSTHRAGLGRVMPGGVAAHLLNAAPCAVAVAPRGYAGSAPRRASDGPVDDLLVIAVAFDASPEATAALELAIVLAEGADATLRVIAVGAQAGAQGPMFHRRSGFPNTTFKPSSTTVWPRFRITFGRFRCSTAGSRRANCSHGRTRVST